MLKEQKEQKGTKTNFGIFKDRGNTNSLDNYGKKKKIKYENEKKITIYKFI